MRTHAAAQTSPLLASRPADIVQQVRAVLNQIGDPCSVANGTPLGLHDMGLLSKVEVDQSGVLRVGLRLTSPSCSMVGYFTEEIRTRAAQLPGVTDVVVDADNGLDWLPSMMTDDARARRRASLAARSLLPIVGFDDGDPEGD